MKTQHTPGPWLVNYAEDRFDSKRSTIEIVDGSYDSLNHEQGPLVLAKLNVIPFAPHMDEPLANAYLISSAPELKAALEGILQWWIESNEGDDMPLELWDNAQVALKKANGGAL
jgi:hypothetical protein